MNTHHRTRTTLPALIALIGAMAIAVPVRAGEAIAIVAGEQFTASSLTVGELKAIFLGKKRSTEGGARVLPLNLTGEHPARGAFDAQILGMTTDDVARYWVDQRIRGGVSEPKTLSSPKLVATVVTKLAGAIGYLPAAEVPADVKIVRIDGHAPGDPGYPLRLP